MDRKNRTWMEVNLDHVIHNCNVATKKAGTRKVMCVVKADAYGHGAVQIASALNKAGVNYFAVATAEEALQLRRHHIEGEILLLGTPMASVVKELHLNNITLTVSSETIANMYSQILQSCSSKQKVHIKVNSGMERQGIPAEGAVEQIIEINGADNLIVEGLYTHLAAADDRSKDEFTKNQYEKTLHIVKTLTSVGVQIPLFHIANSAGIIDHSYMDADMVRPGIMLYGSNPCTDTQVNLKPTMSLHTRVSNILEVKKGESVSYGRTWIAARDSVIAVLNIGYADGLMRCLSGKLSVIVKGKKVHQIGRICMDMCMIDVTDAPELGIGDVATIIGRQGEEEITADEIAGLCGTISYEVYCAIGKRVPRIYIQNDEEILGMCYVDLI